MNYMDVFKMPKSIGIKSRTSSITNSFVSGIIPCIYPNEEEIQKVLTILGMDIESVCCAYCGDKYTEWDHFRPLIIGKRPTGYISEINNLVPACGKCNQSKGNKNWKSWMMGDAPLSPNRRNIPDLEARIRRLEEFESQTTPIKLDMEQIVGTDFWNQHWDNCNELHALMDSVQKLSNQIRDKLKDHVESSMQ